MFYIDLIVIPLAYTESQNLTEKKYWLANCLLDRTAKNGSNWKIKNRPSIGLGDILFSLYQKSLYQIFLNSFLRWNCKNIGNKTMNIRIKNRIYCMMFTIYSDYPTAPTMSAIGKEPHFSFSSFSFSSFFSGPILDWLGRIMVFSYWLTQTWCSTHTQYTCTCTNHPNTLTPVWWWT